jgi:hypothetical protein
VGQLEDWDELEDDTAPWLRASEWWHRQCQSVAYCDQDSECAA